MQIVSVFLPIHASLLVKGQPPPGASKKNRRNYLDLVSKYMDRRNYLDLVSKYMVGNPNTWWGAQIHGGLASQPAR